MLITYIDLRDGKKKKGKVLSSGRTDRSRERNYDNQRIYRSNKVCKGRRSIRRQHYQIRPHDLVKYQEHIYSTKGIQNWGKSVLLKMSNKNKSVSIKKVKCVQHVNGIIQKEGEWYSTPN